MKGVIFIAIILFSSLSFSDDGDVVVVSGADYGSDTINFQDLKRLYLGRASSIGTNEVEPIDLPIDSKSREKFYIKVMKRTPEQMKRYWVRSIFTGTA